MSKHVILLVAAFLTAFYLSSQNTDDLIISEYVEGSSNNKYLEIFNGTGEPVNLDDYEIQIYSNGSQEAGRQIPLEGNLSQDDVFVLGHTSGEIYQESDMEHGWLSFNGNDAVVLFKKSTGTEIDVFGCIGQDPGEAWTADGDLTTMDMTLRRDPDVTEGATVEDNAEDFNTLATEWHATSKDDVSGLGEHPGTATHKASSAKNLEFGLHPNPAIDHVFVETGK
ncbi:MAG: lamin tail domain-containing protein, partial [Marinilabilia sp.]